MLNKTFNLIFSLKIFICFLIFLLFEGIFHFYYYKISQFITFLPFKNQTGYNTAIWSENGLVEILQVVLLFISLIFFSIFIKKNYLHLNFIIKVLTLFYILGILYYFFEEISWGQHIFRWQTPYFFSNLNHQNETNIHNISNLFNEVPRNILLIWCTLSFLLIKFFKSVSLELKKFILPNENLKLISILILIFYVPDLLIDKLDLAPGHPAENDKEIALNVFFEIISFNFVRLSELHEVMFNYYIIWHSYYLYKIKGS